MKEILWQPIETAPKDGTKVLLWRSGYPMAPVGHWDSFEDSWQEPDDDDDDDGACWGWVLEEDLPGSMSDCFIGWNEERHLWPTHWTAVPA